MEKTLQVLNEMEATGIVQRYAIGGAVGAIFYMETFLTYDLDVFVKLPADTSGIAALTPIYEYLRRRGYREEGETVNVEGIPVQFLPVYNDLVQEAVNAAVERPYGATPARVMRPEHLAAIMVHTGRDKDRQRLGAFLREVALDTAYLNAILQRHGLEDKWRQWTTT